MAPLPVLGERAREMGSAAAKQDGLRMGTTNEQLKMQDLYVLDERIIS